MSVSRAFPFRTSPQNSLQVNGSNGNGSNCPKPAEERLGAGRERQGAVEAEEEDSEVEEVEQLVMLEANASTHDTGGCGGMVDSEAWTAEAVHEEMTMGSNASTLINGKRRESNLEKSTELNLPEANDNDENNCVIQ